MQFADDKQSNTVPGIKLRFKMSGTATNTPPVAAATNVPDESTEPPVTSNDQEGE